MERFQLETISLDEYRVFYLSLELCSFQEFMTNLGFQRVSKWGEDYDYKSLFVVSLFIKHIDDTGTNQRYLAVTLCLESNQNFLQNVIFFGEKQKIVIEEARVLSNEGERIKNTTYTQEIFPMKEVLRDFDSWLSRVKDKIRAVITALETSRYAVTFLVLETQCSELFL